MVEFQVEALQKFFAAASVGGAIHPVKMFCWAMQCQDGRVAVQEVERALEEARNGVYSGYATQRIDKEGAIKWVSLHEARLEYHTGSSVVTLEPEQDDPSIEGSEYRRAALLALESGENTPEGLQLWLIQHGFKPTLCNPNEMGRYAERLFDRWRYLQVGADLDFLFQEQDLLYKVRGQLHQLQTRESTEAWLIVDLGVQVEQLFDQKRFDEASELLEGLTCAVDALSLEAWRLLNESLITSILGRRLRKHFRQYGFDPRDFAPTGEELNGLCQSLARLVPSRQDRPNPGDRW